MTDSSLEKRIEKIEVRNARVEADKAWETSNSRKIAIGLLTYFIIGLYMQSIGVTDPWLNAVIPTLGFLLSTSTLSVLKILWLKYIYKHK